MNSEPSHPRQPRRRIESSFFYERIVPIVLVSLAIALIAVILIALAAPLNP